MESIASRNQITLRGSLRELPAFSHENHGSYFFFHGYIPLYFYSSRSCSSGAGNSAVMADIS